MSSIQTTEITAYDEFRAQLAELKDFNDKAVFDYKSKKGNREARSHIAKLRKTKAAVETCRKTEKQDSLEYGRKVDLEAKELAGEIEGMIQVHKAPLDEIERKEKERIKGIHEAISEIQAKAQYLDELDSTGVQERINELLFVVIDESGFQEFTEAALEAKEEVRSILEIAVKNKKRQEDEYAELNRLRAEKEERDLREAKEAAERAKKEREETIARQAADRATRQAEQQAQREKAAADRRERELKESAEQAQRYKEEAEQRAAKAEEQAKEQARLEAEANAHREQQEREARAANRKHVNKVNREAKAALIKNALLTGDQAALVITLIAAGEIPMVKIEY